MKKLFRQNWLVALIFLLAHLAQFWPFYFQHLLPFPGDMLVAFHFPWSGGGFAGFDPWTQYKALNTVDTIRQFYPWKVFAVDLLRQWVWPLWNPYSFSGMPLVGNIQSGVFFPLNLVYFFVPVLVGWVGNVLFQLSMFGLFFYFFLRSEKLNRISSAFGAVVAMNLSYLALWHWQLVITQSALFLPLILYFVNKRKLFLIPFLLAFGFLGGHAQTTVYVYLIFFSFALFRRLALKKILLVTFLAAALASVQILPSVKIYLLSAREGTASKELFAPFVFHWKNIATVLAPDYFGHPSSRNYTGTDYRDMNAYFGLTAAIFSLISLGLLRQNKSVKFFFFLAVFGLLFAAWPLVFVFDIFNIPILSSGVPARMIFVFQFAMAVLAAYGFEFWWQRKSFPKKSLIMTATVIAILWLIALGSGNIVARNNMILPTVFFGLTATALLFRFYPAIFLLLFLQYSYFFNKYNSFSPREFVFPTHPVLAYLQKNAGINRFFGTEQAIFNSNFSVYYKLFDFQGYDSMYLRRYGELIASAPTATIPKTIPRSDASLKNWRDRQSGRLLDILGVKYLLDKNDMLVGEWEPEPQTFSPENYQLLWQRRPWRIYERKTALPRVALFDQFVVETDDNKIISKLYDPNFDYQNQIILETIPAIIPQKASQKSVRLVSYEPDEIVIETTADKPQLLYLSDNDYPSWDVFIDGKSSDILRANYTFRAIALPSGGHRVVFQYIPWAFRIGLVISIATTLGILGYLLWPRKS